MRDMNPTQHPMDNPKYDGKTREPVWYLSHPLAADEKYTFAENVAHAKKMMRLCFDAGFRVVAPYLTIIEILDDDNIEHRRIGLETDCVVAHALGRIIMTGHKRSRGMLEEHDAVYRRVHEWNERFSGSQTYQVSIVDVMIDLTTMNDALAIEHLEYRKKRPNTGAHIG